MSPPPVHWPDLRRILAVRLDNVGDVVLLGPALRAVAAAAPRASITLLASPAGAQVAPLLPWVDDVIVRRVVWQALGEAPADPADDLDLIDGLRRRGFDAALIFTSWAQSPWPAAYACHLAGIPVRAGESKEFGGAVLTHQAPMLDDAAHQADRNLHLVAALGLPAADPRLELAVPPADDRRAGELLAAVGVEAGQPFVAVAPGASCAARRYPPDRFAAVVRAIGPTLGLPVVVVGSERDATSIGPVLATGAPSLVGRTSLAELAGVIRRATAVLANDSGPMHLADAFARPQVVLYSGTELVSQWAPRTSPARVLIRSTPCAPCHRFECPTNLECLDIPPAEVVTELAALLASTAPARQGAR